MLALQLSPVLLWRVPPSPPTPSPFPGNATTSDKFILIVSAPTSRPVSVTADATLTGAHAADVPLQPDAIA